MFESNIIIVFVFYVPVVFLSNGRELNFVHSFG